MAEKFSDKDVKKSNFIKQMEFRKKSNEFYMAKIVHLANTDVEFEYAHHSNLSIEEVWSRYSTCLQLQFLPLLYAEPDEYVAVTALPDPNYFLELQKEGWTADLPRLVLLHDQSALEGLECHSWGYSRRVEKWAHACKMSYAMPTWETICKVNSKAFSQRYSTLKDSALIKDQQELLRWLAAVSGPKVLKTCFGFSGRGNWLHNSFIPSTELLNFCEKEWKQQRPIIGEPWLDRVLDFSTQWMIHSDRSFTCLGATRFETDSHGIYQSTLAGPESLLFQSIENYLEEHRRFVVKVLADIAATGFYGHIGFDALLYREQVTQQAMLYPLVEINARKTMSWIALKMQRRIFPNEGIRLAFKNREVAPFSLLPSECHNAQGKKIKFKKTLSFEVI